MAGIRAAFPVGVLVELVFDGPPEGGLRGRLATGMRVAYSGRATADRLILDGIEAQLRADGPASTAGLLVVTDDRELREGAARLGASSVGTAWLAGRIGRETIERPVRGVGPPAPRPRAGTTLGHVRAPRAPRSRDDDTR